MEHRIVTPYFTLSLVPHVFETDIQYPSNTVLHIDVNSDNFRANTTMDIDIKSFAQFASKLHNLFSTLHGTAKIEEPFGKKCFISFAALTGGHIEVTGKLNSYGRNGWVQELQFENSFDQTYLKDFAEGLLSSYQQYLL